eukprot:1138925-Pelagomonas_calceolata.AAC.1
MPEGECCTNICCFLTWCCCHFDTVVLTGKIMSPVDERCRSVPFTCAQSGKRCKWGAKMLQALIPSAFSKPLAYKVD